MTDKIENLSKSIIQHGKLSDRIYVMEYNETDNHDEFLKNLFDIFQKNNYSKIFAKIPADVLPIFVLKEFKIEAFIPRFFNDKNDGIFASYFIDERSKINNDEDFKVLSNLLNSKKNNSVVSDLDIRKLDKQNADELAKLYAKVFEVYPFPIYESSYIEKTMNENIEYFGCFIDDKLVGASSAEIYHKQNNCEMTDFAVLPELRGKKAAFTLLNFMEKYVNEKHGIKCMYTIARLKEPAMNKVFINANYNFSGTLINNTKISSGIESMNVFYKYYN